MRRLRAVLRPRWGGAAVLGSYVLVSFAYFGSRAAFESGHRYVGFGYNPQIFIWSFAWWPHAILHWQNPFFTREVWAPVGVNTMWSTTVPGLALLFSPLTLAAGPVAAYDVAAVLAQAISAWAAFLLCRYVTRSLWPSLLGGYLFGFGSYAVAEAGAGGNVDLSACFAAPLVALAVLRFLDGELSPRALAVRVGPLVALQFLIAVEVSITLTLALAVSLVLGAALVPARRRRIVDLLPALGGAYLLAGILTSPFLGYLLAGYPKPHFYGTDTFIADLANLVVPTKATAIGGTAFESISGRFPGNLGEQGAYLGIPLLVIVVLYALERRRAHAGRFLVAGFLVAVLVSLGGTATVAGRKVVELPWTLLRHFSFYDDLLTIRVAMFAELAAAVIAALWTARRRAGAMRLALPALAVAALLPNPWAGGFATGYDVPRFFTAAAYRGCLEGQTVLPFPFRNGSALLWEEAAGFRFRMAGGDIGPDIPAAFLAPDAILPITGGQPLHDYQADAVRLFVASKGVTSIVVDGRDPSQWSEALAGIAKPRRLGGIVLYRLGGEAGTCSAG